MNKRGGFTLLEILVVLAFIGIIATIVAITLTAFRNGQLVQQAADQFAADLRQARADARRQSTTFTLSAATNGTSYTIAQTTGGATTTKTVSLPIGTKFGGNMTVAFDPPHGLATQFASTDGAHTSVSGPGSRVLNVYVIGLGGKVVVRAP